MTSAAFEATETERKYVGVVTYFIVMFRSFEKTKMLPANLKRSSMCVSQSVEDFKNVDHRRLLRRVVRESSYEISSVSRASSGIQTSRLLLDRFSSFRVRRYLAEMIRYVYVHVRVYLFF